MLQIKGGKFFLNGEEFKLYSGAIHYFRTVPEYWQDRLAKLKAAGFNTVETYVAWNAHEKEPGKYDFSGILDIERFIETATELGLYVIVRPGPYICAEWEFGGLPAWLLKDPQMRVRCMYKPYLDAVSRWYKKLLAKITPYQTTNGGNVIAMQVENEYGSYGNDRAYMMWVENLMKDCGVNVLLFTSDGPDDFMLSGGTLPHIFKTINFGLNINVNGKFKHLRKFGETGPAVCMEFWNGWFDHWGKKRQTRSPRIVARCVKGFLNAGAHFNMYMFHGGTNFGYWSGANFDGKYWPTVTSYDYDALLTEWGGYTKKYHLVRKAMLGAQGVKPEAAELPPEPKLQALGKVKLERAASFFDNIDALSGYTGEEVTAESMEKYGQNYGFIMYEHVMHGMYANAVLSLDGLADIGYVYVNGKYKGMCVRTRNQSINVGELKDGDVLRVLVEGMGRVNYGPQLHDRKGVKRIRLHNQITSHFKVTCVPWDNFWGNEKVQFTTNKTAAGTNKNPVILEGSFEAKSRDDTFLHLPGFTKGMVWINGFAVGRYWNIGPQKSLYVPGTILKDVNKIMILETVAAGCEVEFKAAHKLC